jgi:transposase
MPQVHVLSGGDRRRDWSVQEKEAILAEAFAPGANARGVARRHDLSPSLLYTWRMKLWKPERVGFSKIVAVAHAQAPQIKVEPQNPPELEPFIEIITDKLTIRIPASASPELASAIMNTLVIR